MGAMNGQIWMHARSYIPRAYRLCGRTRRSRCSAKLCTSSNMLYARPCSLSIKSLHLSPPNPLLTHLPQSLADQSAISAAASHVERLMLNLDWKMWVRCDRVCDWDEVCLIRMSPTNGFDLHSPVTPRCVNANNSMLTGKPNTPRYPHKDYP